MGQLRLQKGIIGGVKNDAAILVPALEKSLKGTFLVVQQLRLHLPMQRVWVQFLVRELRSHVAKKPKHETEADFPGGPAVKNPPASTGDMGLIPGPQRSHVLWNN